MTKRAQTPSEVQATQKKEGIDDSQATTRRLLAEMQALSSRIAAVQEIATAINQSLELDEILDIVGRQAKWLLDFDHCSVCLTEEKSEHVKLVSLFGPPVSRLDLKGESQDPIDEAIRTHQAQLIRTAGENAAFQSCIVLPLRIKGVVLGTINFAAKKAQAYNMDDLRVAYLLALQLASAIHNAHQFKQIRSLYLELEGTYKNLRSLEEMRDQLTHMIAHDLRNPISAMINTMDLIGIMQERNIEPARQKELISRAKKSGHRAIGMIDDMLTVSKIESGHLQLSLAPVIFQDLIKEKLDGYLQQATREEKTFRLETPADLPTVLADWHLINRVIDNLINNAFKYTEPGGSIFVRASQRGNLLEICVGDDGEGIEEKYHEEIFNKFSQVTNEEGVPLRQGTGLGLAFCRLAIEAHFGRIWVESSLNQGSLFFFTLPIVP
jgi:K+-sensing histidine kinase KdpD